MKWLTSANRRRHQRRLNHYMRRLNRDIEKDMLWRGRFVVRSGCTSFQQYEDKSGHELYVELIFKDKRNGKEWKQYGTVNEFCHFSSQLWYLMNKFITEIDDVWVNEGRNFLYSDKTDYTKI